MTQELQKTPVYHEENPWQSENEAASIAEFQGALESLEVHPLTVNVDVGQLDPVADAKAVFFRSDFQPRPAFYALPEISHELAENLVGFEPYVSSAGKSSRHGVFFGALVFCDGMTLGVAVKPHAVNDGDVLSAREAERSCLNDYFTNVAARKCGFESLEPVGFVLGEGGHKYSLTVLEEDLKSLDSAQWTKFFEKGYETTGMRELLSKTALTVALLHDSGNGDSFHGDLRFANIATTPYGHTFPFDWELGKITKAPVKDPEEHFGRVWQDIAKFMRDMVRPSSGHNPGVGMFEKCGGSWWDSFKEVFLDDYMDTRRVLARQGSHHMKRAEDTKTELTQLENALHLEIDGWQRLDAA